MGHGRRKGGLKSAAPKRFSQAVNAPDLWWASSGAPAAHAGDSGSSTRPAAVTLSAADHVLRVFGRSLGWRGGACVNASLDPAPLSGTVLRLLPRR